MDEYLKQAVEESAEAVLMVDAQGMIRFWNRGARMVFGYSADEAMGQSLDLIVPPNLREKHWQGFHRVMKSGETKYDTGLLSVPGVRRDGSRVSLEFSVVLLRDSGGAIRGCAAFMRDVTERWRKEKELREQLAALASGE